LKILLSEKEFRVSELQGFRVAELMVLEMAYLLHSIVR
jgi:hypothetical protein